MTRISFFVQCGSDPTAAAAAVKLIQINLPDLLEDIKLKTLMSLQRGNSELQKGVLRQPLHKLLSTINCTDTMK